MRRFTLRHFPTTLTQEQARKQLETHRWNIKDSAEVFTNRFDRSRRDAKYTKTDAYLKDAFLKALPPPIRQATFNASLSWEKKPSIERYYEFLAENRETLLALMAPYTVVPMTPTPQQFTARTTESGRDQHTRQPYADKGRQQPSRTDQATRVGNAQPNRQSNGQQIYRGNSSFRGPHQGGQAGHFGHRNSATVNRVEVEVVHEDQADSSGPEFADPQPNEMQEVVETFTLNVDETCPGQHYFADCASEPDSDDADNVYVYSMAVDTVDPHSPDPREPKVGRSPRPAS
ncbi:hypothetical protein GGI20_006388, partial [Coemansia sp. BCRC 34301]